MYLPTYVETSPFSVISFYNIIILSQFYSGKENLFHKDGLPVSYTHLTLPTNREV